MLRWLFGTKKRKHSGKRVPPKTAPKKHARTQTEQRPVGKRSLPIGNDECARLVAEMGGAEELAAAIRSMLQEDAMRK